MKSVNVKIANNVYKNVQKVTVPLENGGRETFWLKDVDIPLELDENLVPQTGDWRIVGVYYGTVASYITANPNKTNQLLFFAKQTEFNDSTKYIISFTSIVNNDTSSDYIYYDVNTKKFTANCNCTISFVCPMYNYGSHAKSDTSVIYVNDAAVYTIQGDNTAYGGAQLRKNFPIYTHSFNTGDTFYFYRNSGAGYPHLCVGFFLETDNTEEES